MAENHLRGKVIGVAFDGTGYGTDGHMWGGEFLIASYAGFEPLDILHAIYLILTQLAEGQCEVENPYTRAVPWDGNPKALRVINEVMELRPYFEWRGLGIISHSALKVRDSFAAYGAERRFAVPGVRVADPKARQCGEVLKGVLKPWECKVFGTACTPETPIGTCMVSSEGACAAYYNFGRCTREFREFAGVAPGEYRKIAPAFPYHVVISDLTR
jgi:hydrogenase expression/formation protein HypD